MTEISASSARRRRAVIASALVLTAVAAVLTAMARRPLDGSTVLSVVQRSFTDAIGAEVELGQVRLDLLLSRGLVIEDFELRFRSWTLSAPRAVVRPDLGSLLDGELRPSVRVPGFAVQVDAAHGAEALLRLRELVEVLGFPDASLRLSGGVLVTRSGTPLLEEIAFQLHEEATGPRFTARAQQRGGGRLDVAGGEKRSTGELLIDVSLDTLSTDDLRRWISTAGLDGPESLEIPRLRATAEGHWFIRLGSGHADHQHDFGLDVTAWEVEQRTGRPQVPRMTAHLTGRILTAFARATDPTAPPGALVFTGGSFVRADASLGRLRTLPEEGEEEEAGSRWLVSGPLVATVSPRGRVDRPRLVGYIELDDAHVRIGDWFRKPCGTAARLRVESEVPPEGPRVSRMALELGSARARGRLDGDGVLTGETDWVGDEELGQWFPALEHRITGGRARLVDFQLSSPSEFAASLELDGAELAGRRMPFEVDALRGVVRLSAEGVEARALQARVAEVPLSLDLVGRVGGNGQPLKLSFAVRMDEIDLEQLGLGSGEVREELTPVSEILPPAVSSFAEASIGVLRRERSWLSHVEVERGRLTTGAIRSGDRGLGDIDLEVALRSLRLEIVRLSFRQGGRLHAVSGTIDLNPLVPDIQLAALVPQRP